jgi:hypothetical protein
MTAARAKKRSTRTKSKKKIPFATSRYLMKFPEVKGKKLEAVEFSSDIEDHSISLEFQDKTILRFDIEPGFTMFADYADWKTGDWHPIRRWKPFRSRLFRD